MTSNVPNRASWFDLALLALTSVAVVFFGISLFRDAPQSARRPTPDHPASVGTLLGPIQTADGPEDTWRFPRDVPASIALFFRTDCPSCEANAGAWKTLVDAYPPGIPFYAFSPEPVGLAQQWLDSKGLTSVTLVSIMDPYAVMSAWGIRGVPTTLLVAPDGKVLVAQEGALSQASLERFSGAVPGAPSSSP